MRSRFPLLMVVVALVVVALVGGACGSGSGKVSHVLRAMGMSEADARASIRLGWGRYTSEQALRDGLNAIKDAVRLQGVN